MADKIKIRRGLKADLITLDVGEVGFATDTEELFIGTSTGNVKVNKGSVVTDSATNGNITVDGVDIQVYDGSGKANVGHAHAITDITNLSTTLSGKANTEHTHDLTDLTDVDVTNKTNGYALQYDSTLGKFVSKSLPSGSGSGATNLDGLSDVDVSTVSPTNGNVLKFDGGIWKPGLAGGSGSLIMEDYSLLEEAVLLTPNPTEGIIYGEITNSSVNIGWYPSKTPNVSYNLYRNGSLVTSITQLSYTFTGLLASTNYNLGVAAVNQDGQESPLRQISISTNGDFAFDTLGANNNYIDCPTLSFHAMEMDWVFTDSEGLLPNNILYAYNNAGTGFKWQLSVGNDGVKIQFNNSVGETNPYLFIDNVQYEHLSNAPSSGVRRVWRITRNKDASTEVVNTDRLRILGKDTGENSGRGKVYGIRLYSLNDLGGLDLVSYYNFTNQSLDGKVEDSLGNNPPLTLVGGSFVAG